MPALLVLLFVVVPVVELAVILQVGQLIGTLPTVLLLIADSVLGAWLLRREGRRAWGQFRTAVQSGRWPGDEVTQGALVIVGGTLLLTPGFVTDGLGLLLLLPPTRAVLSRLVRARVVAAGPFPGRSSGRGGPRRADGAPTPPEDGPRVLEVEVVEVERDDDPPRDGSS
ncbi:FxsA family protein [Nitriliruptoraceae bacterium ZYF776]|nr:FxsA family protein [Profundirhabdus halotolerans]